jgi:tripartite-type tricarboxylate transporter receptor subunit TctC
MRAFLLAVILSALLAPLGAGAQPAYPLHPVTVIVPFPPGGVADITARAFVPQLERILKTPFPIANKTGAAGAVGMAAAAHAPADGYTLMIALVSISTIPEVDALFERQPAYTRDQFVGVARLNADPPLLVVNAAQPWQSVADLVADAGKRPGEILYSSSGLYGASHVPMQMFMDAAGIRMRHLPTTGGGPAMNAVLGNHAAMWACPPAIAAPHLAAGRVRALATWGDKRLADFPDVPTMKELGYDVEYYLWTGFFAPRNAPGAVVETLRRATREAVESAEFKEAMAKVKTPIAYQDAPEFQEWWDKDAARLAAVIRKIGKVEAK